MPVGLQLVWLFVLAIPVAAVAWTFTHEEVFREIRGAIRSARESSRNAGVRKFLYLFLCDFCLSHWIALGFIALTGYQLLIEDWRGYVIAFFAVTWLANQYIAIYSRLRLDLKREKAELEVTQREIEE
jgi:hypothetical protein